MNEIEKTTEQYFKELPENLQSAINSTPWRSSVQKLAMAYSLNAEQATSLETETMLVIYGIEETGDYTANIARELSIEDEKAQTIASDITKEIFKTILEKTESLIPANPVTIRKPQENVEGVVPGVIHNNLPMVEEGEKVHDAPHVEPTKTEEAKITPNPQEMPKVNHYEAGKDPYREPLV
jgi:hypothetical protein